MLSRFLTRRAAAALVAVLLLALPGSLAAAGKRLITEKDLFQFVWIADPQISPDGKQVAFVRVTVNEKKEGYSTALWMVPTDGSGPARPFTNGKHDGAPRWSPDGKWIAFVRTPAQDEKKDQAQDPQIHLISAAGGEAFAITDVSQGVGAPVWSPDGRTIAFENAANKKDLEKKKKEKESEGKTGDAGKGEEERESDVRVITQAIYRFNGAGYADFTRHAHLWVVDVPAPGAKLPEACQLTRGDFDEGGLVFSPDGSRLVFFAERQKEPYYNLPDNDLWVIPARGGEPRQAISINGPIGDFAFSPDGRRIAFTGFLNADPERSYNQGDLFVVEAPTGDRPAAQPRNLTADYDFDIAEGLVGDQHAPRGDRPTPLVWSADGHSLIVATAERGRANLQRFDVATGKATPITTGDQEVASYTATPDGSRIAMVISTPTVIGDLYVLDTATGKTKSLVRPNDELFSQIDLTEPEEITYPSFDGKRIQAWIQKPPGFDPGKKYPFILQIHGGPHAAHGYDFFHEVQWMAAKGYVVLYPNPRGSSSYGQDFGNVIQYEFPGDDAKDLLAGVDEMVRRGYVDPKRLGVTGGSGGGILTNWIVTQTDRFAAAVSQRSISNWVDFWYTADFSQFTRFWFRGAPWEEAEDFARRSPITHIDKVKTPLMLIEGEADYRTPPSAGGEQMFRALKYLKRPTVMVRFPGETHELSRSGQPWHRIERLQHILSWFDKYLRGKEIDLYDVP